MCKLSGIRCNRGDWGKNWPVGPEQNQPAQWANIGYTVVTAENTSVSHRFLNCGDIFYINAIAMALVIDASNLVLACKKSVFVDYILNLSKKIKHTSTHLYSPILVHKEKGLGWSNQLTGFTGS